MTLPIEILGNEFILHCSGAMFWPKKNILFISDVHLGKVMHFRKNGIALPPNSVHGNFKQLSKVVERFEPETIIFLGDLFHSSINTEFKLFENWSAKINVKIILVAGNHDIINPQYYENININVVSEIVIEKFLLTHHPEERDGFYNFCGHIHPGVRLRGFGRQLLNLSCFFRKSAQLIFPAFGEFTGKYILIPEIDDIVYVITKEDVILISK